MKMNIEGQDERLGERCGVERENAEHLIKDCAGERQSLRSRDNLSYESSVGEKKMNGLLKKKSKGLSL